MPLSPIEEETKSLVHDIDLEDNSSDITQVASRDVSPIRKWNRSRTISDLSVLSEDYLVSPSKSRPSRQKWLAWSPWILSTILQLTMIILLLRQRPSTSSSKPLHEIEPELRGIDVETGGDINGLYHDSKLSRIATPIRC